MAYLATASLKRDHRPDVHMKPLVMPGTFTPSVSSSAYVGETCDHLGSMCENNSSMYVEAGPWI
jgi:hypothetical protein